MNFSLKLKEELIEGAPRSKCCRRAYAEGLLYDLREIRENCLVLVLSGTAARRECAKAFREQYHRTALLNGSALLFPSEELYSNYKKQPTLACPHCAGHFLRGLLISCGSMTDPAKSYHLEFRLSNAEKVPFLADFLETNGWRAGCRTSNGAVGIYFKNSTVIEEILSLTASNQSLFALINAKISRTIRNEENRATNCVTNNIKRSVGAAARTCEAVAALERSERLSDLSPELRETATLRVEYPEASLEELARLHNPPITKSGLNHRLQKILLAAKACEAEGKNA